jgi:dihydrofolate synthase/folylpolyglutamate synthase
VTYSETIEYLYTLLPVYHRIGPAALKPSLENTQRLCAALGNPERRFRSIHIAGTNGKGSTSSILASVLRESGLQKVGLYTSPHLRSFTERIRVNGEPVPEHWVVNFVQQHEALIGDIRPSFFEYTVAMCFTYFAEQEVDIAVIEVGLGGRLDSTNVIRPLVSVVTSIGYDHMELLGDTLGKIAAEKAGIFKPGIPAVVGHTVPETKAVFERVAQEKAVPSLTYGELTYSLVQRGHSLLDSRYDVFQNQKLLYTNLATDLGGGYQSANIRTALTVLDVLQDEYPDEFEFTEEYLRAGMLNVRQNSGLRGRMEVLQRSPVVLADVAHNAEGIGALLEEIALLPHRQLFVVFGMVQDKDIESVLTLLPRSATYYWVTPPLPRGLPAAELKLRAARHGLNGTTFERIGTAMEIARRVAGPEDVVVVTGSVFVVAEVV